MTVLSISMLSSLEACSLNASLGDSELLELDEVCGESAGAVTKLASELGVAVLLVLVQAWLASVVWLTSNLAFLAPSCIPGRQLLFPSASWPSNPSCVK